jgi:Niemann-Pick C1 protein
MSFLASSNDEAAAEAWEQAFIDVMKAFNADDSKITKVSFNAQSSISKEIEREMQADYVIIGLSYMLMGVYVSFSLGKMDRVYSKWKLGGWCVTTVMLSVGAGGGLVLLMGVKVNAFVFEVVPFLVLALGTDFSFQIVDAFERALVATASRLHGARVKPSRDRSDSSLTASGQKRVRGGRSRAVSDVQEAVVLNGVDLRNTTPRDSQGFLLLSEDQKLELLSRDFADSLTESGPSIILATLVECIALGVGAMIPFKALSAVCLYCLAALAVNAVMQLTLFSGATIYDARRAARGIPEVCACCYSTPNYDDEAGGPILEEGLDGSTPSGAGVDQPSAGAVPAAARRHARDHLRKFVRYTYMPFLQSGCVQAGVLIAFALIVGVVGVLGMLQLKVEFSQADLVDGDSYLVEYFKAQDEYFGLGPPVYAVTSQQDGPVDFASPKVHEDLGVLRGRLQNSTYINSKDTFDWLGDFLWFNQTYVGVAPPCVCVVLD